MYKCCCFCTPCSEYRVAQRVVAGIGLSQNLNLCLSSLPLNRVFLLLLFSTEQLHTGTGAYICFICVGFHTPYRKMMQAFSRAVGVRSIARALTASPATTAAAMLSLNAASSLSATRRLGLRSYNSMPQVTS